MKTRKLIVIALLLLSGSIFGQIVPTSNLVGRWEFSNNFNDGMFNTNPATASPQPPTFTFDRCGNINSACHFNGSQYLETVLPVGSNLTGNNPRSISFWMRTTVTTGPNSIFAYGSSNANSGTFEVNNNYCQQGVGLDVSQSASTTAKPCVNDGNWHHVVVVYPGTNFFQTQYYFDGVLYAGTTCGNGIAQPDVLTSALATIAGPMRFGCNAVNTPARFFTGDLDDFYLYDAALSQADVTNLFGMPCGITSPPCFCNEQNTFTAPNFGPGSTYVWWYTGTSGINITLGQGTNQITATANGNPNGIVHCYITTSCGGNMQLNYPFTYCNNSQPTTLSAPNATLCGNNGSSVLLSAIATGAGPYSYQWTPGNVSGSTYNVNPSTTTNYQVTATSPNACPAIANVVVTVLTNCCQQQYNAGSSVLPSTIGGTGAWNSGGTFIGLNNIFVTSGTTLNGEFLMGPNAKIIVQQGVNLDLSGAHIYACGTNMWSGIEVIDGGSISTSFPIGATNTNLIEDAKTAIDLSNITALHANPPLALDDVTFNKNYIGIKIARGVNSLSNLSLHLLGCVFTSRNIGFTSTAWPSTGSLRATTSSLLAGLAPPCNVGGFPAQNLKMPYTNQRALYGIQIDDFAQLPGQPTSSGVEFGITPTGGAFDFNLFDNLGVGINLTDASLTTMNNIFQNMIYDQAIVGMNGIGIEGAIKGFANMNARLDLRPVGAGNQSTAFGNRFWDCKIGIKTNDYLEVYYSYGTIRSTQQYGAINPLSIGDVGMNIETNRFDYSIKNCEFNNLSTGIFIENTNYGGTGMYDVGSGLQMGQIYSGNLTIQENYFGADVVSNSAITNEYMSNAIKLKGTNSPGVYQLAMASSNCSIIGNRVDRSFRGVSLQGMYDFPVDISGNQIFVIDEVVNPVQQFGIMSELNQGNLTITNNNLSSNNITNMKMSLVYCVDNQSTNFQPNSSPIIHCNTTRSSYNAFEFNGDNKFTSWKANNMKTHQHGLVLSDNANTGGGIIGQQGNPGISSTNVWLGTWSSTGPYHTLCVNSNANLSILFVRNVVNETPLFNTGGTTPYSPLPSANVIKAARPFNCPTSTYPTPPSWRTVSIFENEQESEELVSDNIKLYPNPSNGNFTLQNSSLNKLEIKIYDVTGKLVYLNENSTPSASYTIQLPINSAVYFMEVKESNGYIHHKKLIVNN